MSEYKVNYIWDDEALVWVATSDDIPGLVLESGSIDALMERVRVAAPEILSLNGSNQRTFNFCFSSERHEQIAV